MSRFLRTYMHSVNCFLLFHWTICVIELMAFSGFSVFSASLLLVLSLINKSMNLCWFVWRPVYLVLDHHVIREGLQIRIGETLNLSTDAGSINITMTFFNRVKKKIVCGRPKKLWGTLNIFFCVEKKRKLTKNCGGVHIFFVFFCWSKKNWRVSK